MISKLLTWGDKMEIDMNLLQEKKRKLEKSLQELESVAVAFSAGVDSTFLLKTAHDVLGDKAIAITVQSCLFPMREQEEAERFCKENGIHQYFIQVNPFLIEGFAQNPKNRCYLCKYDLFTKIKNLASSMDITDVIEGSNMDDTGDYRPGLQAVAELKIKSPLQAAQLTKAEIRQLSKEAGLDTWNKPSFACLASRFVYGEMITEEKLRLVERAEEKLTDLGFEQMRVRMHGNMARIEVEQSRLERIVKPEIAQQINQYFHELGFAYVTIDLGGYRMGSMNKSILQE